MKIFLIILGLGLSFMALFTPIIDTITDNTALKAVLFYGGFIILLVGFSGVTDWLGIKFNNYNERRKFIRDNMKIRQ